jgi:hypothetical protein
MNQAEQQIFLDACDTAFLAFEHRNPDLVFSEALAREMALTLQAENLDPRNVHHLSAAWLKVRPSPAAPAPVSESSDPIEVEARRMIADGEVTIEKVRALRSEQFELKCRNLAFCRALDLLPKPPRTVLATRGDVARNAVIADRASKNGIVLPPFDPATEVERSKREVSSGFATHREGAPRAEGGGAHWSGVSFGDRRAASRVANPGRDIPLPRAINARDVEEQRKKDNEFLEAARDLQARATRVRAHRGKQ